MSPGILVAFANRQLIELNDNKLSLSTPVDAICFTISCASGPARTIVSSPA